MGRTRKEAKEENKGYKEFKVMGDHFQYSGRIYTKNMSGSDKSDKYFIYLCLNELFTIHAHFVETDNGSFIAFPQFKYSNPKDDKKYGYYVFTDEKLKGDLDKVCEELHSLV